MQDTDAPSAAGPERVSDRAFRVLGRMRELGPGPHSLNTIIAGTELSRSTVQRIIKSGMREGVVLQARHGYYTLAAYRQLPSRLLSDRRSMSPWTRYELDSLRCRTGHTVCLHAAILVDIPMQSCIECFPGPHGVPDEASPGNVRPLTADAAGKVILAHLNAARDVELDDIASRQLSVTAGPVPGWLMAAAPILQSGIPIGAISVSDKKEYYERNVVSTVSALKSVSARISNRISQDRRYES